MISTIIRETLTTHRGRGISGNKTYKDSRDSENQTQREIYITGTLDKQRAYFTGDGSLQNPYIARVIAENASA